MFHRIVSGVACLASTLLSCAALAQVGSPLPLTKISTADWSTASSAGLDRAFYFGGDNHTLVGTGEIEQYIDPTYCPTADPVQPTTKTVGGVAEPNGWTITVRAPTATERVACHLAANQQFLSGLLTTQHEFSATYGYWELYAVLPAAMRTWPAFWLLPTAKTAANGGADPEIDVMEEYAGLLHMSATATLDRTGRPISTIHPLGGLPAMSCGETVSVKPGTWHTYGVLWEPTQLTFYVDRIATCVETIAVSDPHYLLIDLAMDGRAYTPGATSPALYPATMYIDWVRHFPLRPGVQ